MIVIAIESSSKINVDMMQNQTLVSVQWLSSVASYAPMPVDAALNVLILCAILAVAIYLDEKEDATDDDDVEEAVKRAQTRAQQRNCVRHLRSSSSVPIAGEKAASTQSPISGDQILTPHQVYEQVKSRLTKNSVVGRQQTASCHELWQLERSNRGSSSVSTSSSSSSDENTPFWEKDYIRQVSNTLSLAAGCVFRCYACAKLVRAVHRIYPLCCSECGEQFRSMRTLRRNLGGKVALVVGGRTKLGHQVAMKLLEAGATVVITTRFVDSAQQLFAGYPHYSTFAQRLVIMPLDLKAVARGDHNGGGDDEPKASELDKLRCRIETEFQRLDILVNCAAQTIAAREQQTVEQRRAATSKNRYGDALFVDAHHANSWALGYEQVDDDELRDVIDVNAIAIDIVTKRMLPLLKRAKSAPPYIVNVHAREGLQSASKSAAHYHTNMAKAALHMLTRMLIEQNLLTDGDNDGREGRGGRGGRGDRHLFRVHGVCPGWFSVDEYYENGAPLPFAPLDEIDAASRVCYPIFAQLPSERRTRRHFTRFAT